MAQRTIPKFLFVALLGASLGVACSVAFEDGQNPPPDTFPCNADADCIGQNQVCDTDQAPKGSDYKGICIEDTSDQSAECKDADEDGYGANDDDRSDCPACKNDEPGGCKKDCDDDNANVHPGQPDVCNGTDDNCNDETDEITECESVGDCGGLDGSDQMGTSFACKEVNGTKQCVITGDFSNSEKCRNAHGTCEKGRYTEVPEECTMFQQ